MYEGGVHSEGILNYNLLFCHACLSSNRTLTMVGDYIDIYMKICDNVRMHVTSQVSICWECMTMLKKIWTFKKKVENAQKILDYCVKMKAPLPSLSCLKQASTETTTFVPIELDEECDLDKSDIKMDDAKDELMIKIEDVRGQWEILDEKPVIDLTVDLGSDCDVSGKEEPQTPAHNDGEQSYRRWKRAVLLVFNRICGHDYAHHFLKPVSDELAPLYSRVVRCPTDLASIRRRIKDGGIRTTAQLERELLLMFSNALMYNSAHHYMFHMALELRAETLRELALLSSVTSPAATPPSPAAPSRRRERAGAPAPPVRRAGPPAQAPAPLTRRRASLWAEARETDKMTAPTTAKENQRVKPHTPAATVRRRRATAWAGPPPQPPEPPLPPQPAGPPHDAPAAPRRRAPSWNWSCLDLDLEHLVPRHSIKKCKTVLL